LILFIHSESLLIISARTNENEQGIETWNSPLAKEVKWRRELMASREDNGTTQRERDADDGGVCPASSSVCMGDLFGKSC
jgi:hypothetical protein